MYISIYIKLYLQIEESKIHMQTSRQCSGHVTAEPPEHHGVGQ